MSLLPVCSRVVRVRVTPKASRTRVEEVFSDGIDYKVYVTVVPEGGKANAEVIQVLAKHLGMAPSRLELLKGSKGRDKVVRIDGETLSK